MNAQAKPAAKTLRRLNAKQMYQLTQLVEKHYAEKAVTDSEFADWVTQALGTPVGASSIVTARETLGIPSTKECVSSGGQEVAQLRMMVVNLTERVRVLEIAVQNLSMASTPKMARTIFDTSDTASATIPARGLPPSFA